MPIQNKVNITQLTNTINDVFDAIDRSKLGPFCPIDENGLPKKNPDGTLVCYQHCVNLMHTILNSIIPKELTTEIKDDNSN